MNIGEKIKKQREEKNLSIEDLATLTSDTVENITKYETNEIEPTLDKKLAIANVLGVSLDELSYNINNEEDAFSNEEVLPISKIASSTICYNVEIFNKIFKKDYARYFIQSTISWVIYLAFAIYSFFIKMPILMYVCLAFAAFSVIRLLMTLVKYQKGKKAWLSEYDQKKLMYEFYDNYFEVLDENAICLHKINYTDIIRVVEKEDLIICMVAKAEKLMVVIDKKTFIDTDLASLKQILKSNIKDYIDIPELKKAKPLVTKGEKAFNITLWVFVYLTLFAIFISRIIFGFLPLDNTLINKMLAYIVILPLPIISIILGILAKIKLGKMSGKNIVMGAIVLFLCFLLIGMTALEHQTLKKNNDDVLKQEVMDNTSIALPDAYYTDYLNKKAYEVIINDVKYQILSYRIMSFETKKDIAKVEASLTDNDNWQTLSDDNFVKNLLDATNNSEKITLDMAYLYASYQRVTSDELINVITAYYDKIDSLLVIEYIKK